MTNLHGLVRRLAASLSLLMLAAALALQALASLWAGVFSRLSDSMMTGISGTVGIVGVLIILGLQNSHLKKSRRAAHDMQGAFSAISEGNPDAFYVLKYDCTADNRANNFILIGINDSGADLLGMTKQQVIGQQLPVKRQDSELFEKCAAAAMTGKALEEEFEINQGQSSARWLHRQIVPAGEYIAVTTRDISRQKNAGIETRNALAFLHSIIDHLPMLICARSLRKENLGCMIVWNKAAEAITGYLPGNVIGKTSRESFPVQLAEQFESFDAQMLADPQVADISDVPFERFDGDRRFLHIIFVPLFDKDNRVEYILGIGEDITGRRAQELELRTQQAELAAVNDASPLGLFRTGPDGECTYVNRTYEDMSGLTREQALGDGWVQSIHPEDRLKVFQGWGKSSRTQQPYQGTYRFRHPNGRIVWASMKTAPILLDGQNQGYVGSVDDITARREVEQALSKSEQRLRTITDTLPALVAYISADECYRFNNLAYERTFGIRREEMYGKTIREFLGETEYQIIQPYVRQVLRGEAVTFERAYKTENVYRHEESTYIPQFAEDGKEVVGFHVMIQDITTKKTEELRLLQLAKIDSLTGLVNRAGFEQKLADSMAYSKASNALMAVMYLDIDHFKKINDTYGHLIGDMLLKAFAARLTRSIRSIDTVARLGGDEFTVIMERLAKPEDATIIAAKIVHSMQSKFSLEGNSVPTSASIGVAFYRGNGSDPKTLLRHADEMLYQAKGAGRNTYCIAPFEDIEAI